MVEIGRAHEINGHWIAISACSGLFGFMAIGLCTVTTFQNQVKNMTTIEGLGRSDYASTYVAVWLPHGYTPNENKKQPLAIITYPLPRENLPDQPRRTFAVIECGMNDDLWDLGNWVDNLKSVMGERLIDWFLPIRRSPCSSRDGLDFDYPFGRVLRQRKREYGL
jgi:palmitoyltransferase